MSADYTVKVVYGFRIESTVVEVFLEKYSELIPAKTKKVTRYNELTGEKYTKVIESGSENVKYKFGDLLVEDDETEFINEVINQEIEADFVRDECDNIIVFSGDCQKYNPSTHFYVENYLGNDSLRTFLKKYDIEYKRIKKEIKRVFGVSLDPKVEILTEVW